MGALSEIGSAKIQADAATDAANIQAAAAREAANLQYQAGQQQRADLQPFTQFGSGFIDPTQQAVMQSQQLYSDPMSIMQNPMFAAIMEQNQRDVMQNAAVRGRLGTGGTQQHLLDTSLRTGFDVLNQERQAQMANATMLANLVGMGQSAAAGQGAGTMQAALGQAGYLTDAAAAQAAGKIGVANAISGGIQGLNDQVYQAAGMFTGFGSPTSGGGL